MNIIDYIPVGRKNAIEKVRLELITGLDDRTLRAEIAKARMHTPIINLQDGRGYFIPDPSDEEDMKCLRHYIFQETARLKSIDRGLKAAKDTYDGKSKLFK